MHQRQLAAVQAGRLVNSQWGQRTLLSLFDLIRRRCLCISNLWVLKVKVWVLLVNLLLDSLCNLVSSLILLLQFLVIALLYSR